jgi:hypothetical protein
MTLTLTLRLGPWRSGKLAKYITTLGMGTSFQLVQDLPDEVIT